MNLRLFSFVVGAAIFYSGERFLTFNSTVFLSSLAAFFYSVLFEYRELRDRDREDRVILRSILFYRLLFLFGLVLYMTSDLFSSANTKLPLVLQLTAFLILSLAIIWGVGLELLNVQKRKLAQIEVEGRSRASLSLGFLLVTLVSLNFVAKKTDWTFDASYLKASRAGTASLKTVARLKEPVRVGLFFSRDSEVLPYIRDYFDTFDKLPLKIEVFDKDFNPTQAEEFRVARNGQIVLMLNEKRQRFEIGDKLEEAKRNLKTLDASFLKALLQLTSAPETIYFTSTHGEMLWESGTPVRTMGLFEELLRGLNYRSRRLTSLFQEIPKDAKVVGIIGPTSDFSPEEIKTLDAYLKSGGRIFLALDIDTPRENDLSNGPKELSQYFSTLGIQFQTYPIAHDQKYVALAKDKSDRVFLFSNQFANHPAVSTAGLSPERMTFMSHRTGSFDLASTSDWQTTALVKSMNGSFRDTNGNFEADKNEKRGSYPLVVAAENKTGGRIVAFADATSLSNTLMKISANQLVALDSMRWLSDKTEEAGAIVTEEDVLIRQEKSRETLVFYGSIFLIPLTLLILGIVANNKKVLKARSSSGGQT